MRGRPVLRLSRRIKFVSPVLSGRRKTLLPKLRRRKSSWKLSRLLPFNLKPLELSRRPKATPLSRRCNVVDPVLSFRERVDEPKLSLRVTEVAPELSFRERELPLVTGAGTGVGVVEVARSNDGNADGCSMEVNIFGVHELRFLWKRMEKWEWKNVFGFGVDGGFVLGLTRTDDTSGRFILFKLARKTNLEHVRTC